MRISGGSTVQYPNVLQLATKGRTTDEIEIISCLFAEINVYVQPGRDTIAFLDRHPPGAGMDVLMSKIRNLLTSKLIGKGRHVSTAFQAFVTHDNWKMIHFRASFLTILPTSEMAFPEEWKLRIQGVIDSITIADGCGSNFQLPLVPDQRECQTVFVFSVSMQVFPVSWFDIPMVDSRRPIARMGYWSSVFSGAQFGSSQTRWLIDGFKLIRKKLQMDIRVNDFGPDKWSTLGECDVLAHVIHSIRSDSYECYPHNRKIAPNDDLYVRVKVKFSKRAISTFVEGEYSELDFVRLLKKRRDNMAFSVYTYEDKATDALVRISKITEYWDEAHPWTVPLRVAAKLQHSPRKIMNVRWRRVDKYPTGPAALRAIGCDVDFLVHQPMIISYRGICFPQSVKAVIGQGLSKVTVSDLCLLAIVGSLRTYDTFMRGILEIMLTSSRKQNNVCMVPCFHHYAVQITSECIIQNKDDEPQVKSDAITSSFGADCQDDLVKTVLRVKLQPFRQELPVKSCLRFRLHHSDFGMEKALSSANDDLLVGFLSYCNALYRHKTLVVRLLKILQQPTSIFAILGADQ
ncbi:hypothetical protein CLF_107449, partial [Clonorchis sinensis]